MSQPQQIYNHKAVFGLQYLLQIPTVLENQYKDEALASDIMQASWVIDAL